MIKISYEKTHPSALYTVWHSKLRCLTMFMDCCIRTWRLRITRRMLRVYSWFFSNVSRRSLRRGTTRNWIKNSRNMLVQNRLIILLLLVTQKKIWAQKSWFEFHWYENQQLEKKITLVSHKYNIWFRRKSWNIISSSLTYF